MSDATSVKTAKPGAHVRAFRDRQHISLDDLADLIHAAGCERPSIAKLSRIETGVQPVPVDLLTVLAQVTGATAEQLRPDLAKLFNAPSRRARPRRTRAAA